MKAIIIFLLALSIASCQPSEQADHVHLKNKPAQKYTCSMHPQVITDKPGTCPICGMELVPIQKTDRLEIALNDRQIKLANITTDTAAVQEISEIITANAKLVPNEEETVIVSSRVSGRIEKLFFKEAGRDVTRNEPLYIIYSESLLTLQREYLMALAQTEILKESNGSLIKAAENKLLLYGMNKAQIEALKHDKTPADRITFLSPADGTISSIEVKEGQYVSEGSTLYKIENLKNLWVETELYPAEAKFVQPGSKVEVRVAGFESAPVQATLTFVSPEYNANSQIIIARASIDNFQAFFRPGMQATILFEHSRKQGLAVQTDAVIHDGERTYLFVQTQPNTFQPREVKTGYENASEIEITEGLKKGEVIVKTGAYLLYSDLTLKGMSPHHLN